jgi:hypothetical protein
VKKPRLYNTPIAVAWVLLIAGLLGAFNPAWLPLLVDGFDGMDGGFALTVVGGFIAIMALVVFFYYGRLNRAFREMLAGRTLLSYVLPRDLYTIFGERRAQDVKTGNKTVYLIICGFCAVFGVVFALTIDPIFLFICLGIAAFFTVVYFVTTAYRTKKISRSDSLVCLSEGGVYLFGQLHDWSAPGARLLAAEFDAGQSLHLPCPVVRLTYMAAAYPVPAHEKVTVPVPPPLSDQAARAAQTIQSLYMTR